MNRGDLGERGYEGFVSFTDLRNGVLSQVPQTAGSYAVLAEGIKPDFIEVSRGGHFKGKDPSVKISALRDKWVHGASVAYIGKTENLQRRLREFCRFGAGAAIGHWGGRYLWQVACSDDWLVCWKVCEGNETALEAESGLLKAFGEAHGGRLPFANLRL
jgi:hypothetical protein